MGLVGGQNKKLAATDIMAAVADAVPSASLHAIYEHKLSEHLTAFAVMVAGIGVVAYVGDMQCAAKRVGFKHVGYHLRDDY